MIKIPRLGTFNLHSSLLPDLRGGTSVIWALKNGLEKTGVTLHYVTEGIDDGDIIKQKEVDDEKNILRNILRKRILRKIRNSQRFIEESDCE